MKLLDSNLRNTLPTIYDKIYEYIHIMLIHGDPMDKATTDYILDNIVARACYRKADSDWAFYLMEVEAFIPDPIHPGEWMECGLGGATQMTSDASGYKMGNVICSVNGFGFMHKENLNLWKYLHLDVMEIDNTIYRDINFTPALLRNIPIIREELLR